MSVENLLGDIIHGNFTNAWARLQDFWSGLPSQVRTFVGSLATDEGKILQSLVDVAVKDIETAGFTTVSFVAAGKDVFAKLVSQNINTFNIQHVIAELNITAAPLVPAVVVPTPVPVPDAVA